jgi:hypothetical protein
MNRAEFIREYGEVVTTDIDKAQREYLPAMLDVRALCTEQWQDDEIALTVASIPGTMRGGCSDRFFVYVLYDDDAYEHQFTAEFALRYANAVQRMATHAKVVNERMAMLALEPEERVLYSLSAAHLYYERDIASHCYLDLAKVTECLVSLKAKGKVDDVTPFGYERWYVRKTDHEAECCMVVARDVLNCFPALDDDKADVKYLGRARYEITVTGIDDKAIRELREVLRREYADRMSFIINGDLWI